MHAEAGPHLDRSLQAIRSLGKRAGVAINPATPPEAVAHVLDRLDLILVMTVNPGFGGQAFIPAAAAKLPVLRAMIGDRPIRLEVDGGIAPETAPRRDRRRRRHAGRRLGGVRAPRRLRGGDPGATRSAGGIGPHRVR